MMAAVIVDGAFNQVERQAGRRLIDVLNRLHRCGSPIQAACPSVRISTALASISSDNQAE